MILQIHSFHFLTTIKVFNIEGWHELSDYLAVRTENLDLAIFTIIYFAFLLFEGEIYDLCQINSIFVESIMNDNNDKVLNKIENLDNKINLLLENNG